MGGYFLNIFLAVLLSGVSFSQTVYRLQADDQLILEHISILQHSIKHQPEKPNPENLNLLSEARRKVFEGQRDAALNLFMKVLMQTSGMEDWSMALYHQSESSVELRAHGYISQETFLTISKIIGKLRSEKVLSKEYSMYYLLLSDYLNFNAVIHNIHVDSNLKADVEKIIAQQYALFNNLNQFQLENIHHGTFFQLFNETQKVREKMSNFILQLEAKKKKFQILAFKAELGENFTDELKLKIESSEKFYNRAIDQFQRGDKEAGQKFLDAGTAILFSHNINKNIPHQAQEYLLKAMITQNLLEKNMPQSLAIGELKDTFDQLISSSDMEEFSRWSHSYKNQIQELSQNSQAKDVFYRLSVILDPAKVSIQLQQILRSYQGMIPNIEKDFQKNMSFTESFSRTYNKTVKNELEQIKNYLSTLEQRLKNYDDMSYLVSLQEQLPFLTGLLSYYAEAALNRHSSTAEYFKLIAFKTYQIENAKSGFKFYDANTTQKLRSLFKQDASEDKKSAYFNRRNAALVGLSLAIVAEALTFQLEAVPWTVAAMGVVGKAVLISTSALNLSDRYYQNGFKGLANLDSAFDALVILTCLPRVLPSAVNAKTVLGRVGQMTRNQFGLMQQDAGQLLIYGYGAMGGYEFLFANSIAKDMQDRGIHTSAGEIRTQGLKNIALAILFHGLNKNSYARGQSKHGEGYTQEMSQLDFKKSTFVEHLKSFNPRGGFKHYRNYVSQKWGEAGFLPKLRASWNAVSVPAFGYLVFNEAIMFSYTTPDHVYENHIQEELPYPETVEDEIAVIAIGFHEEDLLYVGAHNERFSRLERRKYGKNLHVIDFESPTDLFDKLYEVSKRFGKIKYLKIATHGLPGMLVTRMVSSSPFLPDENKDYFDHLDEAGYINIKFLQNNKSKLQPKMGEAFASDARVVLVSCLVGSNYDSDFDFEKDIGVQNIGDQFLDLLSEILLVNEGRLDSSTRILVGLDMIYGSFLEEQLAFDITEAQRLSGQNKMRFLPISQFKYDEEKGYFQESFEGESIQFLEKEISPDAQEKKKPNLRTMPILFPISQASLNSETTSQERFLYGVQRLKLIVEHLPMVWMRYGINLDGNFFASRYKHRVVKKGLP